MADAASVWTSLLMQQRLGPREGPLGPGRLIRACYSPIYLEPEVNASAAASRSEAS